MSHHHHYHTTLHWMIVQYQSWILYLWPSRTYPHRQGRIVGCTAGWSKPELGRTLPPPSRSNTCSHLGRWLMSWVLPQVGIARWLIVGISFRQLRILSFRSSSRLRRLTLTCLLGLSTFLSSSWRLLRLVLFWISQKRSLSVLCGCC